MQCFTIPFGSLIAKLILLIVYILNCNIPVVVAQKKKTTSRILANDKIFLDNFSPPTGKGVIDSWAEPLVIRKSFLKEGSNTITLVLTEKSEYVWWLKGVKLSKLRKVRGVKQG
jgi:hypothetical protein